MKHYFVRITIGACLLLQACGADDKPGPAGGGGGTGGASAGGAGGSAGDAGPSCLDNWTVSDGTNCGGLFCVPGHGCGKRCPNDHTEEEVGATFSCGGHYCILGLGCKLDCQENKDCRPGFICDVVGSSKTCSHP
jgi:hypothetical protein